MQYKNCLVCGKEFIKPVNESIKNWQNRHKYCSRRCKDKSMTGKSPWNKGIKTGIIPKSVIKKGEHRGSNTEFKKGITVWNKGRQWTLEERKKISDALPERWREKSGNWKGGITKLNLGIRTLKAYLSWRVEVFKRDSYLCKKCGEGGLIHSHHIKPFSLILKQNNIKNTKDAILCKELWDLNNGITLCIPCHKQTDSYKNRKV